ncbi:MAG: hypothetical protein ACRDH9_11020 [Actinomycetota bacterium]
MPASSKRSWISVPVALLAAALLSAASTAQAGSQADPEITDVAGDANFINGQGVQPGHETGPDTRPASFDNVDLRGVWFETAYTTTKILDPQSEGVLRVEHHPTALLVHVQTQAPARPMSPSWQAVRYEVSVTLPGCKAFFRAYFSTTGPVYTPGTDSASIHPSGGTSCENAGVITSPVRPTFDGPISTMTLPLAHLNTSKYISEGTAIRQPSAVAFANIPGNPGLRPDETGIGRDFTIGQDVPPDVDCGSDPQNAECQP